MQLRPVFFVRSVLLYVVKALLCLCIASPPTSTPRLHAACPAYRRGPLAGILGDRPDQEVAEKAASTPQARASLFSG